MATTGRRIQDKWIVVGLLWLTYFFNQADRQVIFSIFPVLQRDLRLTNTQLGMLGSSFQWVYGLLVPLAGCLGDVVSRKKLIVAALIVWSAATFSSGLTAGFGLLLLLRAITGTGEAFYYPAATSILSDYHSQGTRSFAMSIHQTSVYCGIVSSGALAGYIGEVYGWRWAFLMFGIIGLALAVILASTLREPQRGEADWSEEESATVAPRSRSMPLRERLTEAFNSPTAVILVLAFLGMNFVNVAYLTWMPTLLYEKFHYSLAAAGFNATFYHQFGAFWGVMAAGKLADRWAVRARVNRPLVQAVGLLVGAPFIALLGSSRSSLVVFTSLTLFGLFRGVYDSNLFASLYEVVRPEARATATGMMLAVAFLAAGSAAVVTGWLSERIGLSAAVASTSVWYLAGGLLVLLDCFLWFRRDAARMQKAAFTIDSEIRTL